MSDYNINRNDNEGKDNRERHNHNWWGWAIGAVLTLAILGGINGFYATNYKPNLNNNQKNGSISAVPNGFQLGTKNVPRGTNTSLNGQLGNTQLKNGSLLNSSDLKTYLQQYVGTQLSTNVNGKMKLRNVSVAQSKTDKAKKDVEINLNSGPITNKTLTRDEIARDIQGIVPGILLRPDVAKIAVNEFVPVKGTNGKFTDKKVFTLVTTYAKLKSANMNKFTLNDLKPYANSYTIDPLIR